MSACSRSTRRTTLRLQSKKGTQQLVLGNNDAQSLLAQITARCRGPLPPAPFPGRAAQRGANLGASKKACRSSVLLAEDAVRYRRLLTKLSMFEKVEPTSYHSRDRIPREPGHADAADGLRQVTAGHGAGSRQVEVNGGG